MSLTTRFLVACASFLFAVGPINAAEIKRSVPEILSDQPDEYSRVLIALTRCSGFYFAMAALIGRQIEEYGETGLEVAAERSMKASFFVHQMLTEIMKERGLTETDALEKTQVVAEAYARRMKDKREMMSQRQALRQELESPKPDRTKLDRLKGEINQSSRTMLDNRVESILVMKETLTPEQFQKLQGEMGKLRESQHGGMDGHWRKKLDK